MKPMGGRHVALGDRYETRQPGFRGQQIITIGIQTVFGRAVADRQQLTVGIEEKREVHSADHLLSRLHERRQTANEDGAVRSRLPYGVRQQRNPGQACLALRWMPARLLPQAVEGAERSREAFGNRLQHGNGLKERRNHGPLRGRAGRMLEQGGEILRVQANPRKPQLRIPSMTFHTSPNRIGPSAQIPIGSELAFLSQCLRHIRHRMGQGGQLDKSPRPFDGIHRPRQQRQGQRVDSLTELLPCHGVCLSLVRSVCQRFTEQPNGIVNARKELGIDGGSMHPLTTPVGKHNEMSREIAAVHGGHILRIKRLQPQRVVPVEEMSVTEFETAHRRQRRFQALARVQRAEPPKVAGGQRGQQVESDIRR